MLLAEENTRPRHGPCQCLLPKDVPIARSSQGRESSGTMGKGYKEERALTERREQALRDERTQRKEEHSDPVVSPPCQGLKL